MGFQQGLSGLNSSSRALDVIGNNISNSSTVGFKSGSAKYADVYAASLNGAGTGIVGLGAKVGAIAQEFNQGGITVTNNPLDTAINGGGFFQIDDGSGGTVFSRNGQFQLDKNGYIVNANGRALKGILAQPNGIISPGAAPVNLRLYDPTKKLSGDPLQTGQGGIATAPGVQMNVNLDSREATPPLEAGVFNYKMDNTYNKSTAATIYDSLGNAHTYTMYFRKMTQAEREAVGDVPANSWQVYGTVSNPEGASTAMTDLSAAGTVSLGIMSYDTSGQLSQLIDNRPSIGDDGVAVLGTPRTIQLDTTVGSATYGFPVDLETNTVEPFRFTQTLSDLSLGYPGAVGTPENLNVSPQIPASPNMTFRLDFSGSTQFGSNFAVNAVNQDGYASGTLSGFNIDDDGIVTGRYSNGKSKVIGQIILASFLNPEGLQSLGDNLWSKTITSGTPVFGAPGSSGRYGAVQSAALEDSNVDMTGALVTMITQQRAYQASAQTIKTQDSILQTLVNLR